MRKQGSSSPLPRKINIKKMKIRIVKNVTVRQCSEKSKENEVTSNLGTWIKR